MAGGSFSGGNGTPENPFLISDVSDLRSIKNNMTASYQLIKNINLSYSGKWQPIGYLYEDEHGRLIHDEFTGVLDGKGFSIEGMDLSIIVNSGLFVTLRGARILDVTIKNASYKYTGSYNHYYSSAGMFCNESFNSQFVNCKVVNAEIRTNYFRQSGSGTEIHFGFFVQYSEGSSFTNCRVIKPLVNFNHNEGSHYISLFATYLVGSVATKCHVEGGVFNFSVIGSSDSVWDYFLEFSGFADELTSSYEKPDQGSTVSRCSSKYEVNQSIHSNRYHLTEFYGFAGTFKGNSKIENSFLQAKFNLISAPEHDPYIYEFVDHDRQDGYNRIINCYSAVKSDVGHLGIVSESFAGNEYNVIDSCYNDSDIFVLSGPYDENRYPQGNRTTKQMKTQGNYEGWDFENIWLMKPGDYPMFRPEPSRVRCNRMRLPKG